MATAQSIINSARYDLTDYVDGVGVGVEYDDIELLNHLNRMIGILDSQLSALQSDLVEAEELDIDTVADQNYIDISGLNSGLWQRVRSIYIGSNKLDQTTVNYMRYTRRYRGGSSRPTIWALWNSQILFPQDCDQAYTNVFIYYDKKTAELALTDSMPYADRFNEFLREMMVQSAKMKKQGSSTKGDLVLESMFKQRAMREEIQRGFIPRPWEYWEF
jgi:hypothetical protein